MISQTDDHHRDHLTPPAARRSRLAVISASQRRQRMGPLIADWVVAHLDEHIEHIDVDLIDLAEIALPSDSLLEPGGGPRTALTDRIAAAGAFVFVTPEYNHSYPASLKRLIDWHYQEWSLKAATIVAYGVQGGYAAVEHLRGVLAELSVVTTRRAVGLRAPWESINTDRYAPDTDVSRTLAAALRELRWWADLLDEARRTRPFPG